MLSQSKKTKKETKARSPRPEEILEEFKRADIDLVDLSVSIENQIGWSERVGQFESYPTFRGQIVKWKVSVVAFDKKLTEPPLPSVKRYGLAWSLRSAMFLASTDALRHPIPLPGGMDAYIQNIKIIRSSNNRGMVKGEFDLIIPDPNTAVGLPQVVGKINILPPTLKEPEKKPIIRPDAFWADGVVSPKQKMVVPKSDGVLTKPCGLYGCTNRTSYDRICCEECEKEGIQ